MLTFVAAPLGMFLYLVIRALITRGLSLREDSGPSPLGADPSPPNTAPA